MRPLTNALLIVFAICAVQAPLAVVDVTLKQNVTARAMGGDEALGMQFF